VPGTGQQDGEAGRVRPDTVVPPAGRWLSGALTGNGVSASLVFQPAPDVGGPARSQMTAAQQDLLIHTIGHSSHEPGEFIALLSRHAIELVVDVRSQPYSQWTPQFNRETLAAGLQPAGVAYHYLGDKLGGRPSDTSLYQPGKERPDYERLAQTEVYLEGIAVLLGLAAGQRLAVMCSEGDHRHCHRYLLIAQTLVERHVRVLHIQPDGSTVSGELIARQLSLFG
jgi:uncharacterized protein (DUF488 family)